VTRNTQLTSSLDHKLFFAASDPIHGQELWESDGTARGTFMVQDINPGSAGSAPSSLTSIDGTLYFTADDGAHGRELWAFRHGEHDDSDEHDGHDGHDGESPRLCRPFPTPPTRTPVRLCSSKNWHRSTRARRTATGRASRSGCRDMSFLMD
jgi:ELWxxDGT repeat protein